LTFGEYQLKVAFGQTLFEIVLLDTTCLLNTNRYSFFETDTDISGQISTDNIGGLIGAFLLPQGQNFSLQISYIHKKKTFLSPHFFSKLQ